MALQNGAVNVGMVSEGSTRFGGVLLGSRMACKLVDCAGCPQLLQAFRGWLMALYCICSELWHHEGLLTLVEQKTPFNVSNEACASLHHENFGAKLPAAARVPATPGPRPTGPGHIRQQLPFQKQLVQLLACHWSQASAVFRTILENKLFDAWLRETLVLVPRAFSY